MRFGYLARAALVVAAAVSGMQFAIDPAVADTYAGKLHCEQVPGSSGALSVDFSVDASGNSLSYSRAMKNNSGATTNITESGQGTVAGDKVDLKGGAQARNWSYVATYSGTLHDGKMRLSGEQLWTGSQIAGSFHRACHADLAK